MSSALSSVRLRAIVSLRRINSIVAPFLRCSVSVMPVELISYRTRNELLHFFDWKSVYEIVDAFCQAGISCPSVSGPRPCRVGDHDSRRNLVEQYYQCLDFANHADAIRFLRLCATAMRELERNLHSPELQERDYSRG